MGCVISLDEFRKLHSHLIEHYQFIESHLEGLYAAVSGQPFIKGLEDVERDNIPALINKIHTLEKHNGVTYLTREECDRLKVLCKRRNFWCHNCYYDLVFDSKTGGLKKQSDLEMLKDDFDEAERMRNLLFAKKIEMMKVENI